MAVALVKRSSVVDDYPKLRRLDSNR